MRLFSTIILIAGALSVANADSVNLRNGEVVQGTYLGGTARQLRVDVNGNIQTFDVGQVLSVTFSDANYQQPVPRPQQAPPPQAAPPSQDGFRGERERPRSLQGMTIPADTAVTVRMIESVNSQSARLGQTFRASVDEPVVVDGQQVIPRGADVLTKLVDDQKSGKFEGRSVLTLALVSINVNGQPVDVTSSDVKTSSSSRGARTAGAVGGGTALGAIVGALAGGGKGAAIGAASGAALGGGAEVMTNGQQVKIPSETRLTFRLQSPVQI
jgi:hypothetical protein